MLLDTFLEQAERRAYHMALYATKNPEEALDIVQDAMMKLAQQYGDKSSDEWPPLFHRILQSRINDWFRRENVRKKWRTWLSFTSNDEEIEDPLENIGEVVNNRPDDKLSQSRAMSALDDAVNQLPLRQQQAFLLRCWEGLSTEQTAKAMNCSQGSVKTHYSRAIHQLRENLEDFI